MPEKCIEFFNLIGIETKRLIDVRKPLKADTIIIPEMGFIAGKYYYKEFKDMFDKAIINAAGSSGKIYEKIYFTRTKFKNKHEIGEELFEKIFKANGFHIVSPEDISVKEQIKYLGNCRVFASVEGTIAHNIIFANKAQRQIILRKHKYLNVRQALLDEMAGNRDNSGINVIYLDVSQRIFGKFPIDNSGGFFWLRVNKKMKKFCLDNAYVLPGTFCLLKNDIKNFFFYLIKCFQIFCVQILNQIKEKYRFISVRYKIKDFDNLIIYGAGKWGKNLFSKMQKYFKGKSVYLIDSNYLEFQRQGESVTSLSDIISLDEKCFIICIGGAAVQDEIEKELIQKGIPQHTIYRY